jgi:hypothetical protein
LSSLQRGYEWLLAVYPEEFREQYGIPMTQVFRDRCREEFARRGNRGLVRLSLHTFFDLLRSAVQPNSLVTIFRAGLLLSITLPLFLALIYGIATLNPQYFTGDLAPERLMFLLLGLLGGTALILVISGLNSLKGTYSESDSSRQGPLQVVSRLKKLLGKASRLTFAGVMGGLYLSSALLGLYLFFVDSPRMIHPQAFTSGSLVLACVTLAACCLTARKAMCIDPVDALRCE